MRAVGLRLEPDHSEPSADQAGMLTRAEMVICVPEAREQPVAGMASFDKSGGHGLARGIGEFEWYRPPCLLLDDRGTSSDGAIGRDVAETEPHVVAASQLAIDGAAQERQVPRAAGVLELLADRRDVLGLQWWLGADDAAGVPGVTPGQVGFLGKA